MKALRISAFLIMLAVCSSSVQMNGKYWVAGEALIKELRAQSPKFEEVSMRDYSYRDLNYDKTYEIIESINQTEEKAPGFLNAEIYPAFELHRIYYYSNGKFQKNYKPFSNYLAQRMEFYSFWKRQVQRRWSISGWCNSNFQLENR